MHHIEQIGLRIEALARHPRASQVFGAESRHSGHGFRRHKVAAVEVVDLEARIGVALPREYKELMATVGGHVGPYYGLFTPQAMLKEIADVATFLEDGAEPANPARDFPITRPMLEDFRNNGGPYIPGRWPADGCVPVCFQGCQFWSVLVTGGEFTGTVWDVACYEDAKGQWLPARRPPGIVLGPLQHADLPELPAPPTLLQWYEGWVERVESDLAQWKRPPLWRRLGRSFR
jgi:hypothetical protein